MLGLMLLTSPGKVSGTETIIATAARQFCENYEGGSVRFGSRKGLLLRMYTYTSRAAGTLTERRHMCGVQASTKRGRY